MGARVGAVCASMGVLICLAAAMPAAAQGAYKCGPASYAQYPCSRRVVNTADAPVPTRSAEARRQEQRRLLAQSMRPRPGETTAQFETRRRRARLSPEDGAECARLQTRIPLEQARMNDSRPEQVMDAESALESSRKRFAQLRC